MNVYRLEESSRKVEKKRIGRKEEKRNERWKRTKTEE
jgi:hypothetical protein